MVSEALKIELNYTLSFWTAIDFYMHIQYLFYTRAYVTRLMKKYKKFSHVVVFSCL